MPRFSCQTVFAARIQPEEIAELPPNMAPACTRSAFLAASTAAMQPAAPPPGDQNVCCEIKFLRSLRGRNSGQ